MLGCHTGLGGGWKVRDPSTEACIGEETSFGTLYDGAFDGGTDGGEADCGAMGGFIREAVIPREYMVGLHG